MAAPGGLDAVGALKRFWGFGAFRPAQHDVIQAVLAGRDALVIMATGSGKSIWCAPLQRGAFADEGRLAKGPVTDGLMRCLCSRARSYQVPPLVSNKVCIVVSPLISLMQDQARGTALTYCARCLFWGSLVRARTC
jgi:ATP-dependent DNA helicase RecQ